MNQFDGLRDILAKGINNKFNMLLIGPHGAAKTAVVRAACADYKMLYWSGPLVDPDGDIGGLPMPDEATGNVRFFTPAALIEAEVVFIDELNRATPRTLNMFFELLQFRSIHGKPLPKLRAVLAAINPPDGRYDVETLDPALLDRFHAFYPVTPVYSVDYLAQVVSRPIAQALVDWIEQDVQDTFYISPRRLEYAARLLAAGMDHEDCFLDGPQLPIAQLKARLGKVSQDAA